MLLDYLSGMYDEFREEGRQLVLASDGHAMKAMLEFGYLKTDEAKRHAAGLLSARTKVIIPE